MINLYHGLTAMNRGTSGIVIGMLIAVCAVGMVFCILMGTSILISWFSQ